MNKRSLTALLLALVVSIPCCTMFAQEIRTQGGPGGRRMMQLDPSSSLVLGEVGAIVAEENGKVKILMVPPAGGRPPGMPEVDLLAGDEVGMAAGKSVKTVKELKELYQKAEVGKEFKLGVRRDGQAHIVAFEKKSEKDLPQGGRMVFRREEGEDPNSEFFPAFGVRIKNDKAGVVVSELLPHAPKELAKGDVVKTLNGKEIKKVGDFSEAFGATTVGGELKMEVERDGKNVVVIAKRPKPMQQIIRN